MKITIGATSLAVIGLTTQSNAFVPIASSQTCVASKSSLAVLPDFLELPVQRSVITMDTVSADAYASPIAHASTDAGNTAGSTLQSIFTSIATLPETAMDHVSTQASNWMSTAFTTLAEALPEAGLAGVTSDPTLLAAGAAALVLLAGVGAVAASSSGNSNFAVVEKKKKKEPEPEPEPIDVSIPYDAAARMAFCKVKDIEEVTGEMEGDFQTFKTLWEAKVVADVTAKKKARDLALFEKTL